MKINLPWYADGYASWARVSQLYAGDRFGSTWVPEVEAEVLVAFAHGDMRCAVRHRLPLQRRQAAGVAHAGRGHQNLRTPAGSELPFDETKETIDLKTPAAPRSGSRRRPARSR